MKKADLEKYLRRCLDMYFEKIKIIEFKQLPGESRYSYVAVVQVGFGSDISLDVFQVKYVKEENKVYVFNDRGVLEVFNTNY